jgi:transketolase
MDAEGILTAARETGGRIVVVEDHYPEGGLGAAVMEALADAPPKIAHLAVRALPTSGKPEELLNAAGISARHIAAAATKLLKGK